MAAAAFAKQFVCNSRGEQLEMDALNISSSAHPADILLAAAESQLLRLYVFRALFGMVLVISLCEIWFRNTYAYQKLKNMPGPVRLPLLGNAHLVLGLDNKQIMQKAMQYFYRYGDTVCGALGYKLIVFLSNPADLEVILSSPAHMEKSPEYRYFAPWFGNGLLISNGDHWRLHRKMIAPTFHQSILKSFVPTFVQHSHAVAERMRKGVGKEFDVHHEMSQVTVEILLGTVMGLKKIPEGNACSKYAQAVLEMCNIIHNRQLKIVYRLDALYKHTKMSLRGDRMMNTILSLTRRVINERMQNFNAETDGVRDEANAPGPRTPAGDGGLRKDGLRDDLDDIDESVGVKCRLALLDAMVEMTKNPQIQWTETDVMDEVNTIMFEGHDTTSAGSSFVLCMLGIHADVQARVLEEQHRIFGDDALLRDCTFADTLEMNYLERVIKETLRLYPPVPVIARRVNQDVKLASGPYTIPAGTTVVMSPYTAHRCASIYENPDQFDPDNFLPEKVSKRHYYSYIPFSAGPRSCVGRKYAMLMLKVLLSTLLRQFEVHCNIKEADFHLQGDIILKMGNGFRIVLVPRV